MASERLSFLATPSATREVLERHGLFTKYGLGQNFLVNDDVIRRILDLADVSPSDFVLEVGPGIGTLTVALLQRAERVFSIEKDDDLAPVLAETTAPWADRFDLLNKDALDVEPCELRREGAVPNKLVANLPYAVAATVVLGFLQQFECLQSETVMVQKEVADRMMARPGTKSYGAYTVKLGMYAHAAGHFTVAPGNFFPPPHVESAVIRLDRAIAADPETGNPLSTAQLAATCQMADAAFATRRKTIANSCKTYFSGRSDAPDLTSLFERAGIDSRRRGETLGHDEFIRLGLALEASPDPSVRS